MKETVNESNGLREAFYQEFEKAIADLTKERGMAAHFDRSHVVKPGNTYEGLVVIIDDSNVQPVMNMDAYFEISAETGKTVKELAEDCLLEVISNGKEREKLKGLPLVKGGRMSAEDLFCMLIPEEGNEELLSTIPSRPFLNMRIIAKLDCGNGSATIKNDNLKSLGMTADEVIDRAISNSVNKGHRVAEMSRILFGGGMSDEESLTDGFEELGAPTESLICMTNHTGVYGANCLLNKPFLKKVSDYFGGSCYILPSSIHECIAVADHGDPSEAENLTNMVKAVNAAEVSPEERLSNTAYFLKDGELRVA